MSYILKIELLSDACICSGASYGASVDTDVYTNEFGFPYIPSKRLKGLFREAFNEYNYMIEDVLKIDTLLGTENDIEGKLKISNAELSDFENEKEMIINDIKNHSIPSSYIKDMYVSTRTQTSVNSSTGEAKEKSLRSTNVVNKGLVFTSTIDGINEDEYKIIKDAIKLIKHMGLHRNRGLGLVKLTLEENKNTENKINLNDFDYLELHINNEEALMISSNLKDKTLPYISGSSIYGFFANEYAKKLGIGKDEYNEEFNELFLKNNLIFTNGYISDSDYNEYVPVPSFIQREKNKGPNNTTIYVNMLDNSAHENKIATLSNKFIRKSDLLNEQGLALNDLHIKEPEFEYNYHTALENGVVKKEDGFYSYFSLAPNQHFVSKIYGDKELIKKLVETLNTNIAYFGKCKNSQYGKCKINYVPMKNSNNNQGDLLIFTAPCVINDEKNNSVLDIENITKELEINNRKDYSLKYASFGGYNYLWNLPKKHVTAIQMESYIEGEFSNYKPFIGDDNHIGFGEVLYLNKATLCKENKTPKQENKEYKSLENSMWYLKGKYYHKRHYTELMEKAFDYCEDNRYFKSLFNSTQVEKLLRMVDEQPNFSALKDNVSKIAKESFKKNATKLFKEEVNEDDYKVFYKTTLTLIKYALREKEVKTND